MRKQSPSTLRLPPLVDKLPPACGGLGFRVSINARNYLELQVLELVASLLLVAIPGAPSSVLAPSA